MPFGPHAAWRISAATCYQETAVSSPPGEPGPGLLGGQIHLDGSCARLPDWGLVLDLNLSKRKVILTRGSPVESYLKETAQVRFL